MDLVPVLLQVVPQMEGTRGVTKAFPADNKKEFHGFRRSPDSGLPLSIGHGCLLCVFPGGFRDDDPGSEINDEAGSQGEQGNDDPDKPDNAGVDPDMSGKPPADPANNPIVPGAVQPFHVHKMAV